MKKLVLIILLTIVSNIFAQKNMAYVELLGNGGLASLNYERLLRQQQGISFRIGIGVSFLEPEDEQRCEGDNPYCNSVNFPNTHLSIPFSVQYLIDLNKNNYLETGVGYTFQFGSKDRTGSNRNESGTNVYFASIGFRKYFGKERKWMWKINFTPILGITDSRSQQLGFGPWGGLSFGRRF